MLESVVDEAILLLSPCFRSLASSVLVGDVDMGGELAREDLSERRVSEKELSRLCCFGMSTAGVATSAGPSTPVFTMLVVLVAGENFGDAFVLGAPDVSALATPSLDLCSLLRTKEPTRFPKPPLSGEGDSKWGGVSCRWALVIELIGRVVS